MGHVRKGVSFSPHYANVACVLAYGFQHSDLIGVGFYGAQPVNCGTAHILGFLLMNSYVL